MQHITLKVSKAELELLQAAARDEGLTLHQWLRWAISEMLPARCRACGCTEEDCSQCIEKTGQPCHWVEPDLCSACAPVKPTKRKRSRS